MKRLVSFGNVLSSRRWHGLRKGSGFLWPSRAVGFDGVLAFQAHSGTWFGAFGLVLLDSNLWFYVFESAPTNAGLFPIVIRMQNFVSYTGNIGAQGVGYNALGFPIVYDKFRSDQQADFIASH